MIDLETMAKSLAEETRHRESDWRAVLDEMVHEPHLNQMSDGEIHDLAESVMSPSQLKWLVGLLREMGEKNPRVSPFDFLTAQVSASSAGLRDWIQSLHLVFQSAAVSNKPRDLKRLADYVSGCLTSPEAQSGGGDLVKLVREKLDQHGYEG